QELKVFFLYRSCTNIVVKALCLFGFLDASTGIFVRFCLHKAVIYKHFRPWVINILFEQPTTNAQKNGLICINIDDDLKSKIAKLGEKYAEKITLWYSTSAYCAETLD